MTDGRLQLLVEESGAQIDIHDHVVGAGFQALAEACALFVQRRVQRVENVVEAASDGLLANVQALVEITRAGDQRLVQLAGAFVEGCVQLFGIGVERGGAGLELTEQLLAALCERLAQIVETGIEFVAERNASGRQAREQGIGAGRQHGADRLGGAV